MKKFFLLIIPIILLSTLFLSGCGLEKLDRKEELKVALETTSDELQSNFSGSEGEYSLVSEYLKSWANKNKITISKTTNSYMLMTNPATKGCNDKESTLLQCQINTKDFSNSLQTLSVALTALMGPENHGDIALIVTENNAGHLTGAAAINPKYLKYDNFINLKYGEASRLYTDGAYSMKGTMTSDITTATPSYKNAYKITMKTTGYSDPFDFNNHYPNPIETIGNLLATGKSSGQLFQLASFNCDAINGYTPHSATAIVVIDNNDVDSFINKFNNSYEKTKKRFEKLEQNFVYTMTETSTPETVLSNETSDNIISLMYTLKTGIYSQNEDNGEIISASNISSLSTANNEFKLTTESRSSDKAVLEEMKNVFLTTSGLCEIKFVPTEVKMTWSSDKEKTMLDFFKTSLGSDNYVQTSTLQTSECNIISNKVPNLNIISYSFDMTHRESAMLNIIQFIESISI